MDIATELTIVIVAGMCGGIVARLFRQPLVLGYLLAGVLVGPHAAALITGDLRNLELLAEIGVTLLLFGLGLELSLRDLAPVRRVAVIGTPVQIGLAISAGVVIGRLVGLTWTEAIWLGALISLSSTLVVLKALQAQGRIGTLSSRVMVGMLVVQDLAFVPLMIVLPRLGGDEIGIGALALASVKAAAFLLLMLLVGTRVIPRFVAYVARSGSRELFLLVTMGIALGIGYLTHGLGLSSALGAFVAGLVLSESDYSHQALSDIIPLRDVFSLLFFVSVGMLLDPAYLVDHWRIVAFTVVAVAVAKGSIFAGVTRAFGYRNVVPLASALALFQVGEFSFVLARVGLARDVISSSLYSLVLNTAVVTMALTPLVSALTSPVYAWWSRRRAREPVQTINVADTSLAGHVVVAGAGRVGLRIADVLHHLGLPFVLIELDHRRIDQARDKGFPIIFGDAAQPTVLEAAHVGSARLLLVTTPVVSVSRIVVEHARGINPGLDIVARAEGAEAMAALRALEVTEVVQPELEASLEMTRQALLHLRVPSLDIVSLTDRLRLEHYAPVHEDHADGYALVGRLGAATRMLDFKWVRLEDRSPLAGGTIGERAIRSSTGVSVVGVLGAGGLVANPGPDHPLAAGDLVAVVGDRDQLAAFERASAAP